jgi:hypothetical protein
MLDHKPARVPPVVEDLTSKHVPSDAPHQVIPLVLQPLMTESLRIKIMDLITRMVDMEFGAFEKEEAVMIDLFFTAIKVQKCSIIIACRRVVHDIRGFEVEPRGVEVVRFWKISDTAAEMADLVYGGWAVFEALDVIDRPVLCLRMVVVKDRQISAALYWCLVVHQMK